MRDRTFRVFAHTVARASVTVRLPEEKLRTVAENLGGEVGELTLADLRDVAADEAFERGFPNICAQCAGWGQPGVSLALGDDWELDGEGDPRGIEDVVEVTGEEAGR